MFIACKNELGHNLAVKHTFKTCHLKLYHANKPVYLNDKKVPPYSRDIPDGDRLLHIGEGVEIVKPDKVTCCKVHQLSSLRLTQTILNQAQLHMCRLAFTFTKVKVTECQTFMRC